MVLQKLMVNNRFRTVMFQGVLLAIWVTVSAGSVAPGDEEPLCKQLRGLETAPIPAYSANMTVLMDSWNYQNLLPERTGAVWEQVDNDENNPSGITSNWIQNSNTPCGQSVQVCGFSAGPQNNWLITQLISRTVSGTRLLQKVSVMIEFEMQGCDTTSNCQRTFNTHVYETSTENATAARNTSNYQQVQRVSPEVTDGSRVNETIMVYFNTNHSSFYLAVQDETTCMIITRLIVLYTICPAQTANLIQYPETTAPSTGPRRNLSLPITALCIENAEPENGVAPTVTCAAEGIWGSMVPGAGCRCVSGYFGENETCTPCPVSTYLSPSNGSCLMCPANSVSEEEGLTQCTCVEGYNRAPQGGEDLPCTVASSTPQQATAVPLLYSLALILAYSIQ